MIYDVVLYGLLLVFVVVVCVVVVYQRVCVVVCGLWRDVVRCSCVLECVCVFCCDL